MSKRQMILHVEDDFDDAYFVRRAFELAGDRYTFHRVEDGQGALDYLAGAGLYADRTRWPKPDAILLDLKLPIRTGFDVLTHARSKPEYLHLPIIVLTSSNQPEDIDRAMQLGASAYLNKSVSSRNVIEMLDRVLTKPAGESSPAY